MSAIDRASQFPRGINLDGEVFIGETDIDPSSVGFVAPIGSQLHNYIDGKLWRKIGPADNAWVRSNADAGGFQYDAVFIWNANGNFQTGIEQDGMRIVVGVGSVISVEMYAADRGGAGNIEVDIKKHSAGISTPGSAQFGIAGTSIYSTAANRPKIAGDSGNKTQNGLLIALAPDDTSFTLGDFYTMDIIGVTNASRDLTVAMLIRYN